MYRGRAAKSLYGRGGNKEEKKPLLSAPKSMSPVLSAPLMIKDGGKGLLKRAEGGRE